MNLSVAGFGVGSVWMNMNPFSASRWPLHLNHSRGWRPTGQSSRLQYMAAARRRFHILLVAERAFLWLLTGRQTPRAAAGREQIQAQAGKGHEGQEFVEIAAWAPPGQPPGAAQGPRLHHQQDQPALQGAPGLNPGSPQDSGLAPNPRRLWSILTAGTPPVILRR